jgi:hypothetical protein
MWPFRSKGDPPGALDSPAPRTVDDWASLPPIEGVVGQIQRTIDSESFQRDLAVQQPPHPFLEPLGHAVSAEAPAGTVAGLITTAAQPTQAASELTYRTSAEVPHRVQRQPASSVAEDRPPVERPSTEPVVDLPSPDIGAPTRPADAILSSADGIELPRLHLATTPEPPSFVS